MKSSDQYIHHYEYKQGKVLIYFGEVSKPNDFPISAILDSIYKLLLNLRIIGFHTLLPSCDFFSYIIIEELS